MKTLTEWSYGLFRVEGYGTTAEPASFAYRHDIAGEVYNMYLGDEYSYAKLEPLFKAWHCLPAEESWEVTNRSNQNSLFTWAATVITLYRKEVMKDWSEWHMDRAIKHNSIINMSNDERTMNDINRTHNKETA